MWGTDMTQTITIREGRANVFVAVEHANSEVVGIHASRSANRFECGPSTPSKSCEPRFWENFEESTVSDHHSAASNRIWRSFILTTLG
jgi:hypothetical protein